MAQKIRDDKIGTLSHSAGSILMAASIASPAYLTIGGQQFKVTSQLSVALPSMTANTRYQVYAVQSAGVVSLIISTRENSQGPIGYSRWKLVGSLYSSGKASPDFGCFMTISGIPTSIGYVDNGPMISGTHLIANINPSFTTTNWNTMRWWRKGRHLYHDWELSMIATGGAGSGTYRFLLPFAVNTQEHTPNPSVGTESGTTSGIQRGVLGGLGHITNGASRGHLTPFLYDNTSVYVICDAVYAGYGVWSNSNYALNSAQHIRLNMRDVSIAGWTDTAIEDL